MQIKPITNDDQWFECVIRGLKANNLYTEKGIESFVIILIRTQATHNWLNSLPTKGRKNKGYRYYKMVYGYFDKLTGQERIALLDKYFAIDWTHRIFSKTYDSMMSGRFD